ncbi:hypothetical protein [Sphingomonas bacterium]|uniref:hypothetical protein n=1 Tax=Sphingomonas bacterium TaxID=1895847 RepID=UPI002634D4C6|nr:hypothetical protein [Sphingomonas bacterium]
MRALEAGFLGRFLRAQGGDLLFAPLARDVSAQLVDVGFGRADLLPFLRDGLG